ncbi:undecaprenyl/decaprenyl-phosphate alpha-N-acetylglucosaminyl 1-phosphate transferase [Geomonas subterranea]|uniref:Undecaprenyl/decaprenyl-phosphate alpha-N-acetylglucosaminyl 1-phosphate transferase n=1 Tax=Geomonas subterranea TaxID=2847989 RepID=A0ABX8LHN3_9BACT|nr:MraY family glycosyltransferase [Geomonas subterranea]QXE91551.1 undecaprenyl/decaprenyl-phosphate alpha-N-acetylglucosaminyl 1-phosphate transferase [Geomonas subterranea]QXM10360.1 undecaprenyl/decaprenyl-phosphate alpha-N-acetylglucosaminyl 1-phosphate transferase [Geomonas subterranea]
MIRIYYVYIFLTALISCSILVPYAARLAIKVGGVDQPDERKVHSHGTPRLGGVAVFCSVLFSVIFFCGINQQTKGFLVGAIIIFLTGLADDLVRLTPRQKLIGELLAVGQAVLLGGIRVNDLGTPFGFGPIELGFFAIPFTIFAIVGLVNAINLLDGMDGLAGGVCAIACISFAVISFTSSNHVLSPLVIALLGSIIGFLLYNHYPAHIFLGDSGSLLLGYCMGIFSVFLATGSKTAVSPYLPLIILGVPILDTLVVMINRRRYGRKLFQPDKTHLHHRLLGLGISHKLTVLIVVGISYLFSVIAIFGRELGDGTLITLLLVTGLTVYGLLYGMTRKGWFGRIYLYSDQALRTSYHFRYLVRLTGWLLLVIKYLLGAVFLMPLLLPGEVILKCATLLLMAAAASAAVYLMRREWRERLLVGNIYLFGGVAIFALENFGRQINLFGVALHYVSHGIFLALLICAGSKIFIRKRASLLIVSPFDYLLMLIVLSAPLIPLSFTTQFHLLTVTAKTVIFLAGTKLVLKKQLHFAAAGVQAKEMAAVSLDGSSIEQTKTAG